ncbi:response regulator transcription factor [Patescibacteria group bacterium]
MADDSQKILLIDDDTFLLDMYSVKFNEAAIKIDVAQDGEEALDKIRENKYKAILLDIIMPNLDGFELLKKVKEEKLANSTPIIILSNLGQRDDLEKGLSLGADDYIVKANFTPSEVLEKLKEIIERKNKK